MADTTIGPGARIDSAILDKYVRVGEGSVIGAGPVPRDAESAWLEGLTLIGKDTHVPPGSRIGRASVVGVGSTPGDFAGGELPAGSRTPNHTWIRERVS